MVTVYIVLGVLYESFVHPVTILSTLPPAGIGALLFLWLTGHDLDVIGIIGIVLLIGIVKKNAIMMVDFALEAEREEGLSPRDAIHRASLMRFRPILMTTMAAILGALPLMLASGSGAELRQPLGIAMIGGLAVSQLLTLFTTPAVYLVLDRLGHARPRRVGAAGVNVSALFIRRPVATTLLTLGIALAGIFAFDFLPVSPLPQVDFPTIRVQAQMAGASPDTMAATVAAPLERRLGAIADVSEMTSQSSVGTTSIILQFGLNRDINGAARDVQAAIAAARADLPAALKSNPTYSKFNPADAPILILGLTSKTLTQGALYDTAATVLQQQLSQLQGIGNVDIGGSSLPAVRVELNPGAVFHYGIGLESIRAALAGANANSPKGIVEQNDKRWQIYANDQGRKAADYRGLVIAYRNGAAVRLEDVAEVTDSVESIRNQGLVNGQPSVILLLFKQPGGNITETIDRVKAMLPQLQAALPADAQLIVTGDRSVTIRASLTDTEETLLLSVALVILVVFAFLRDWRATLIPAIIVPVSIIGTFAVMYLFGYSLDNLSLMALTVATGFVVDDAIVVLENVTRHIEAGMTRFQAALQGAREVGFTVLSMSVSLIAVFLPILLMGGIVGRLFREFAVVLSISIVISLLLSLTTTPMLCARLLRSRGATPKAASAATIEAGFAWVQRGYGRSLGWALRHRALVVLVLAGHHRAQRRAVRGGAEKLLSRSRMAAC